MLAQFDKKPLRALLDGSLIKPGINRLPVMIPLPPGISLVNSPPPFVTFSAERKEERDYAVDVMFSGTPPAGQMYDGGIATPGNVVVKGSASDLKRVARIVASVEREPNELSVDRVVDLYAQDINARRVEGVEIVPTKVTVTVKLAPVPTTKNMILTVRTVGASAPGFSVASYEIEPNQVLVRGSLEALSAQSSIAVPVDVTGAKETFTKNRHALASAGNVGAKDVAPGQGARGGRAGSNRQHGATADAARACAFPPPHRRRQPQHRKRAIRV